MLRNVLFDLLPFGVLFGILIFLISMTFCVLGAGNQKIPGAFQDKYREDKAFVKINGWHSEALPNEEYE